MTTDFLITVNSQEGQHLVARHVKYEKDLAKPRNIQEFKIEQLFWENRGIELKAVTERSFDRRVAKNIAFLMGYYSSFPQLGDQGKLIEIQNKIDKLLIPSLKYQQIFSLMISVDNKLGLPHGTALSVFFHLASHKEIPLQMQHTINGTMHLSDIIDWSKWEITKKEVSKYAHYA